MTSYQGPKRPEPPKWLKDIKRLTERQKRRLTMKEMLKNHRKGALQAQKPKDGP